MVAEEARRTAKAEVARLEEDHQKALEVIFSYGYECCVFKHICGDQPTFPNGMPDSSDPLPPEFFVSPRYPPFLAANGDTTVEAHLSEVIKEPEGNASAGDQS